MTSHDSPVPVRCPKDIRALLDGNPHPDPPLFVSEVIKINDHYQAQKRTIAFTAKTFYNIKRSFWGWHSIQRSFPIATITGLVRNPGSCEFVLKLDFSQPNDYRYQGDCVERFSMALLNLAPKLQVWTLGMDLDVCVRRKSTQASSPHLLLPSSASFS